MLRYLKSTANHGLYYTKLASPEILCYSDADWGGDHENRKSTSGVVTLYSSGPITFKSQQQPVVALSTTEAEYISASFALKDLIWIQRFLIELGIDGLSKLRLLCDNQSAIKLIKNPEFHQRSKHIDIRFHFIRDSYESNVFEPEYVSTDEQLADLFTKSLSAEKHKKLRNAISCVTINP